jgi:hypothetical protein
MLKPGTGDAAAMRANGQRATPASMDAGSM